MKLQNKNRKNNIYERSADTTWQDCITRCQARCDIMEAIRNMEPAWEKVNGLKFQLVEYKDAKGELRPITRCQARCDKARCDISKSMAMKSRIISSYISQSSAWAIRCTDCRCTHILPSGLRCALAGTSVKWLRNHCSRRMRTCGPLRRREESARLIISWRVPQYFLSVLKLLER